VTTIFKVVKKQHFMEGVNASNTITAAFTYTHPLAKMFTPGKETLYAECTVKGNFVDAKKLVTEQDFINAQARKSKEKRNAQTS